MALTKRRQPVRRMLVVRDITIPEAAEFVGCPRAHLTNAMLGRCHPSAEVRARLPILIGLPLEALFEGELLAGEYTGRRGRKAVHRG